MVSPNTQNSNKTENSPKAPASSQESQSSRPSPFAPPSISLPKGGGAIRGMGEKFAANPVTGTGSMSVPIAVSPGRGGFGPQLSLSYDSGAGNGPFGLGWNLSLPAITRKTDKGLPRYNDAEESDVFILSGAEDLVPVLNQNGQPPAPEIRNGYQIKRYRPRIEGLFARIERWTNTTNGEIHWRSITKDNLTTLYGRDNYSRIFDPAELDHEHPTDLTLAHPKRIFSWLISESYDDKGNAILYEYKPEESARVTLTQANETNRTPETRSANRYLKRIKYCNQTPRAANEDLTQREDWLMEVAFDYADHNPAFPTPNDDKTKNASGALLYPWTVRDDPFSTYRSGFEVRTYRLCQRVLMFHHFPNNSNPQEGYEGLVRSTDFTYTKNHIASFISKVTQSGYSLNGNTYLKRSLPPVEFTYSKAEIQNKVEELDAESLDNLPIGLDGSAYQWVDLDGEGLSGILTEQADAWFYKRNLSPLTMRRETFQENGKTKERVITDARFAPLENVAVQPSFKGITGGGMQFLDLAGDGRPDLVQFDGVTPGFFEHTEPNVWEAHRPFKSLPNVNWRDPNLKFIDLTGDGHADILISEDEVFTWYQSLAEDGFGPSEHVRNPIDEEKGPRIVFADATQSIYLADFSGDGLTGIVRIRNGEVCYWPNLGYGRFGAKVTMDNAPWFDHPDQFDQRRIRLADIDGSGLTDIIYLHGDGVRLYYNQSGNRWSDANFLDIFPPTDNLSSVTVADLLGNGTACLVWSSPLPGEARRQMRYVDLLGGQKPHLMISSKNNLGAETHVQYAPSTKFYLEDKYAGKPWITRLPFPVHVVEKVTVTDQWRKTKFSSTYSYHHGYFDGVEREFRGFGRVEQVDIESYDKFEQGNTDSPFITPDKTLYQPPIKTVTWFHTGAFFDRERILNQFQDEYFSKRLETLLPVRPGVKVFRENVLPEPDVHDQDLSAEEWREALRACKGMTLRQEVYELDVDELHEHGKQKPVRLFSTAYHNCHIRRVQPKGENKHAVFLVTESEAITYNYELDLRPATPKPDPRIAHTFNLNIDEYGNIRQSVAVVYPRLSNYTDSSLPTGAVPLINKVQNEFHVAYTETRYTGDVNKSDAYRLRVPCEVMTYELTKLRRDDTNKSYFTLAELRGFRLSNKYQTTGKAVAELAYHLTPNGNAPQKRLVEHARTLFFKTDLANPELLGTFNHLGLPYENYKLALTDALLSAVFGNKLTPEVHHTLETENQSGYLTGSDLTHRFPDEERSGQYWIRSGIAGFNPDAAQHFYLPENYTDPFGNITSLDYDPRDLYIKSSRDALLNRTEVVQFDFRVMAPREMVDANGNHSEAAFDVLGQVIAVAAKGKFVSNRWEGDDLSGFDLASCNPPTTQIQAFCTDTTFNEPRARGWLNRATTRFVYHFGEARDAAGNITAWASRPAGACAIQREIHASQTSGSASPLQVALECSDGSGNVLMKKVQAESETQNGPLRWIVNGLTVFNNKGKPVKQYEPAFSDRFGCELPSANGVTPVMYYDAAGRLIRTELPDGSLSRVEFSPWHVTTFDANDTVLDSRWYKDRNPLNPTKPLPIDPFTGEITATPDQRAAWLAAQHANTPAMTFLDSLGREVVAIAHNRVPDAADKWQDEKYLTFTKLDAEGKPLWIRDARGNLVMQYITLPKANNDPSDEPYHIDRATGQRTDIVPCYDIAGNLLFQHSMDAGDRWMLMDAAGKPMLAWDFNQRRDEKDENAAPVDEERFYSTEYDALHRPVAALLRINDGDTEKIERYEYRDTQNPDGSINPNLTSDQTANLIGQLVRHYDPSGMVETVRRDFKGNVKEVHRTLVSDPRASRINWQSDLNPDGTSKLERETFTQITEYDALNRMTRLYNWHREPTRVAIYEPKYNERSALKSEELMVAADTTRPDVTLGLPYTAPAPVQAIREIRYNVKGQKELMKLGSGAITHYDYDPFTFRLLQLRTTRLTSGQADPAFPGFASNLTDPRVLQQLHYTYDPVGNITEIYDEAYEPVFFKNQHVEPRSRYTYDALYRLVEAIGREGFHPANAPTQSEPIPQAIVFPVTSKTLRKYIQRYTYDVVGNIKRMQHMADQGNWHRRYDYATDSNRLLHTWEGDDDCNSGNATNKTTYHYDTHGSMLNLLDVAEKHYLRWDHRDMIANLDLVGGGLAYYQYDAGKQRTRKYIKRNGGIEERIYLGGYELYRRKNSANQVVEEIESLHLFEGEQRVLLVDDVITDSTASDPRLDGLKVQKQTLFRYQYSNHLGSACLELDHQAGIISYEEYHPYGTSAYRAMKSGIEVPPKRYRFNGMERDEESELSYHGARYYLTWLCRWCSPDPNGVQASLHFYNYANCRPSNDVDLNGKQSQPASATGSLEEMGVDTLWNEARKARLRGNNELASQYEAQARNRADRLLNRVREDVNQRNKHTAILLAAFTVLPFAIAAGIESLAAYEAIMATDFMISTGVRIMSNKYLMLLANFSLGLVSNDDPYMGGITLPNVMPNQMAPPNLPELDPLFRKIQSNIMSVVERIPKPQVIRELTNAALKKLDAARQAGRHVLNVIVWDEQGEEISQFWVISGSGGKRGHTEFVAMMEHLVKEGVLKNAKFILMQGIFKPCTTRGGEGHSCHDVLRVITKKGVDIVYSTESLREDLGLDKAVLYFYEASEGYFRRADEVFTQAPEEVRRVIQKFLSE